MEHQRIAHFQMLFDHTLCRRTLAYILAAIAVVLQFRLCLTVAAAKELHYELF